MCIERSKKIKEKHKDHNCSCKVNLYSKGDNEHRTKSVEFRECVYLGDTFQFEEEHIDTVLWEIDITLQQEKSSKRNGDPDRCNLIGSAVFTREGFENGWYEEKLVIIHKIYII